MHCGPKSKCNTNGQWFCGNAEIKCDEYPGFIPENQILEEGDLCNLFHLERSENSLNNQCRHNLTCMGPLTTENTTHTYFYD